MKKANFLMYTILPVLVLASIVAIQAFKPSTSSVENTRPYIGLEGDVRRLEAQRSIPRYNGRAEYHIYERFLESQQSIPDTGAAENGHTYAGTGDPQRFRVQRSIQGTSAAESGHTYAGTGDPPRFRARQSTPNTGSKGINRNYAGTELFHRIEAEQSTQK